MHDLEKLLSTIGEYLDYVAQTPDEAVSTASGPAENLGRALRDVRAGRVSPSCPDAIRDAVTDLAEMIGNAVAFYLLSVVRAGDVTPKNVSDAMADKFAATVLIGMMVGRELGKNAPPKNGHNTEECQLELID